ncbi:uncharacterized protein DS421_4g127000 [Arachis hypogaea]|nr:uncharacterized protein DS421_4g127000 [Arachis hypogaea]
MVILSPLSKHMCSPSRDWLLPEEGSSFSSESSFSDSYGTSFPLKELLLSFSLTSRGLLALTSTKASPNGSYWACSCFAGESGACDSRSIITSGESSDMYISS